jgi:putative chitinase
MFIKIEDLKPIFPRAKDSILQGILDNLSLFLSYDINTPERAAMCLAQLAHESDGFRTTREYASGSAYEGRRDLGNVVEGDGIRFRGRGLIQLTGRANYQEFGKLLGTDLESSPELVESFPLALEVSLLFWRNRGCNELADQGDFTGITKRINGGLNGFESRTKYLNLIRDKIIPLLPI